MKKCLFFAILCITAFFVFHSDVHAATGIVSGYQKISDTEGGFEGILDSLDYFGISTTGIGDYNGDNVIDIAIGAYGDDDGGTERGAVWIMFMNIDGTVDTYQKISSLEGGFTGVLNDSDDFGTSVTNIGDYNGDGINELAIGANLDDDGGTNRGAVWILFMNSDGTVDSHQKISDTLGNFTGILIDGDNFGYDITEMGDLNDDGVNDMAVGAVLDDDGGTNRGAVWILFMNSDGTVNSEQKISDTEGNFNGILNDSDQFGYTVTNMGDLDNDGVNDLAVGSPNTDDGGTDRGSVWILFLNANGTVKAFQEISDTEGNFDGVLDNTDRIGRSISCTGDLNYDGINDLATGAFLDDDGGSDRGAIWILFLNSDGTVKGYQKISDTEGNFEGVLDNADSFGTSVSNIGDFNNDGTIDLAVGAYRDDDGNLNVGATWILFLDTKPPDVSLITFIEDTTTESTPAFQGTSSDTASVVSSVEFQMDDTSGIWTFCIVNDGVFDEMDEDFTCELIESLGYGEHIIYIRTTDALGNMTISGSEFFYEFEIVEELSKTGSNILICFILGIIIVLLSRKYIYK